jgi:poly(3-hydroxybutyrate) depolymerase
MTNAAGMGGSGAPASDKPPATSLSLPVTKEKHMEAPTFNLTRPENISEGGPFPVVVWANGGCFRSDFTWDPLFQRWAKGGFVVLHLTGTGSDDDIFSMLGTTTKAEHKQLIDWVEAQNKTGMYAGKLDLERIVVAGNSCGGVTALQVAAEDDRLAAVFVLSGSSSVGGTDTQVMKNVQVPVGFIVGGPEDIAGANAAGDYEALNDGIPAMIVNRRAGDHPTVSTDAMVLPEVAEISLNWMDLAVNGTKAAYDALNSANHCDNCTPGDWMIKAKNLEKLTQ